MTFIIFPYPELDVNFGTIIEVCLLKILNLFMRYWLIFILLLLVFLPSFSQIRMEEKGVVLGFDIVNGDTIFHTMLDEQVVRAPRIFKSKAEERKFWRLVHNVKKTYPYARLAGEKLHQLNEHYLTLNSEKEKKKYSKQVEKELMAEFEGELRKLTITQGRILLRLVDRETGNTTYEILKDFRGSLSAFFWQTVAKIFGSNLKARYDPSEGEDKTIEQIIIQIEEGSI
ncbi:MAG: DUF4294 domain-containing protein [Bacteroidales bacterium]|jgi:hypothetical protein|nr:DUF4294 domain-containing protein [Bacteroidales bacterium]